MLTNDQILAIGRQFFKEKPDHRQEALDAYCDSVRSVIAAHYPDEPIPMVLYCPNCGMQHIDAPDIKDCHWPECGCSADDDGHYCIAEAHSWDNPPHRSHLCTHCSHIWRVADMPTTGVKAIQTRGQNDSAIIERPILVAPQVVDQAIRAVQLLRTLVSLLDSTQYCNSPSVKAALKFLGEDNNENAA